MLPAGIIDLHCDTLTREQYPVPKTPGRDALDDPVYHLALSKMPPGTRWAQCYAIFIPDSLRGQEAVDYFDRYAAVYSAQMAKYRDRIQSCRSFSDIGRAFTEGKFAGILTVEGGAVLAGRLERVETIRQAGVRMLTLTWNAPNELGSGHDTAGGLTPFGREAAAELERQGILVDVSHLNDRGFEDLLGVAKRPFVASHSNARAVCGHPRNLPDAFIKEIAARGGLIGLNFCKSFLSDGARGSLDDLYRHVCHFLELGAGECLALGSDYDGADIHPDLDSIEKTLGIHGYLTSRGIPAETADGIVFGNAWRFFQTWLNDLEPV